MPMERTIFREEHNIFRESVRRFMDREVAPYHDQWEKDGIVPRDVWRKAGDAGLLLATTAEEYGGSGADFQHCAIVIEEGTRILASGLGFQLHSDIVAPYIEHYGSEDLKRHWLPRMATGEIKIGRAHV